MTGFAAAVRAVRYIRENDCDFLTVANVQDYTGGKASEDDARAALRQEMGDAWADRAEAEPRTCPTTSRSTGEADAARR